MDVIIAMGHFCETHGPCVILCTQKAKAVPDIPSTSHDVPVCNACESLKLDTAYVCQDEEKAFISTRTALDPSQARLLNDAALRSLSVEVVQDEGANEGTMYFGDNIRGHIITHVFKVRDSLARGFKRKYSIIVMGKHQTPLLHHYTFLKKNLRKISVELQEKAEKVNESEQRKIKENINRGTSKPVLRSLNKLVGEPFIFAHLHMWFVFLLRAEIFRSVNHSVPNCPADCSAAVELRKISKEIPQPVLQTIIYCILTGIDIKEFNLDILKHFYQVLPTGFTLPAKGEICKVSKSADYEVNFKGFLPKSMPRMQVMIEKALKNKNLPDSALSFYLTSLVVRWFNIACVLSWTQDPCQSLLGALEVRKCDMPLLSYWIPQSNKCVKVSESDWFIADRNVKHS